MSRLAKRRLCVEGPALSIITYGPSGCERSLVAAKQAEQQGISVEVIDSQPLQPYDPGRDHCNG